MTPGIRPPGKCENLPIVWSRQFQDPQGITDTLNYQGETWVLD
jgi:hypothetical protein